MNEEIRSSYEAQLLDARGTIQEVAQREAIVTTSVKAICELNNTLSAIVARQEEILKEMNVVYNGTTALLNEKGA